MIECASKLAHVADSNPHGGTEDPMNLARVMINKGLATDLAQIPNYIDLGSPNMAETVNAALKPLEVSLIFPSCDMICSSWSVSVYYSIMVISIFLCYEFFLEKILRIAYKFIASLKSRYTYSEL